MKVEFKTAEIPQEPRTRNYSEYYEYALLFGDGSGPIAIFRDEKWANAAARELEDYAVSINYRKPVVMKIIDER